MIVLLLVACTYDTWAPTDTGFEYDEVESANLLAEGLEGPVGITRWLDEIFVVEEEAGRVLSIDSGEIRMDDLVGPTWLVGSAAGLLVADSAGGAILLSDEAGEVRTLSEGHQNIGRISSSDDRAWWLDPDAGELWTIALPDGSPTLLTDALSNPVGLDIDEGIPWVLDQDDRQLYTVDASTGELTTIVSFDDPPHDLFVDGDTAFVTTRSTRWPYGGFLVSVSHGEITRLCDSPPEPERIEVDGTHVYWTSKQSITRVEREGGTYELVSASTAVTDLWIESEAIFWTDGQAGEVRSW